MSGVQTWLVTGASGLLGHALCRHLVESGKRVVAICNRHGMDSADCDVVHLDLMKNAPFGRLIEQRNVDVVLHAAGITNVDACENDEQSALHLHAHVAAELTQAAAANGAQAILISTDHLWGGDESFVLEDEPVAPMNAYARTKAVAERMTLDANPDALVLRTNFFGKGRPWRKSLSDWVTGNLAAERRVHAFEDVYFTPLSLSYFCPLIERMAALKSSGIFHVCGSERVSKYEFALRLARRLGFDESLVIPGSIADAKLAAPRPKDMSLSTAKAAHLLGHTLPDLAASLDTLGERAEAPREFVAAAHERR